MDNLIDKIEDGKIYFVSKDRSSQLFKSYTDEEFSRFNEKFKLECCENVAKSYIKDIFIDLSNRIVNPLFPTMSYNNKDCLLISKLNDQENRQQNDEDMDRLIEELQNNILNAPFTRVPIYEKLIGGCKIFVLRFPALNDAQFNYLYELLSVVKNKVLKISSDESERSDIYSENLKTCNQNIITLDYFIRYYNVTEIGIEKYDNENEGDNDEIYLTFSAYGDCNIAFDKIKLQEKVQLDEEENNLYSKSDLEHDEGVDYVLFNLELVRVVQ